MTVIATPSVNMARSTLASSFTRGIDTTIVLADGTLFPSPTPKGHVAYIHETDEADTKFCLVIYTSKATNTLTMGGGATDYALAKNVSVGDEAYEFPIGAYVDLVCAADEIAQLFTDAAASIHNNVVGEITAIAEKTTPVAADKLLVEDSEASDAKKMVQYGSLGTIHPIAQQLCYLVAASSTPCSGYIAGTPTTTSVTLDDGSGGVPTNDHSLLYGDVNDKAYMMLYNTTKGNSRKLISYDRSTHIATTVSSSDDWADNDEITTLSDTGWGVAIDLTGMSDIPAGATGIVLMVKFKDSDASKSMNLHPYTTYNAGKRVDIVNSVADLYSVCPGIILPIIDRKICVALNATGETVSIKAIATAYIL